MEEEEQPWNEVYFMSVQAHDTLTVPHHCIYLVDEYLDVCDAVMVIFGSPVCEHLLDAWRLRIIGLINEN